MNRVRVLAIHFGSLGDFVLSWHALGRIAAWAGRENLMVAVRRAFGELVAAPTQVMDVEGPLVAGAMSPDPPEEVIRWLGKFDVVVGFSSGPRQELARNAAAAGSAFWQLPTRPPAGRRVHVVRAQLEVLEAKGLTSPAPPLLPPLPSRLPTPCPVVAPGSGGVHKRLEPELAASVIDELSAGTEVKVIFGPAEEGAYRQAVLAACKSQPLVVADPSLKELLVLLAASSPYMGADSGVTHLAAAIGAPTVAIFTSTDPGLWAPVGTNVEVIRLRELTPSQLH